MSLGESQKGGSTPEEDLNASASASDSREEDRGDDAAVTEDSSQEFTSFAPFEGEKASKLRYKGPGVRRDDRIQIATTHRGRLGAPAVIFRKLRTPTPTPTLESTSSQPPAPPKTAPGLQGKSAEQSRGSEAGRSRAPSQGKKTYEGMSSKPPGNVAGSDRPGPPSSASSPALTAQAREGGGVSSQRRPGPGAGAGTRQGQAAVILSRMQNIERNQSENDLKRYWMPDKFCKECSECQTKFSLFIRRHHCRICGRIFCNSCCSIMIPGFMLQQRHQSYLRVCRECFDIFNHHSLAGRVEPSSSKGDTTAAIESSISSRGSPPAAKQESASSLGTPESPLVRGGSGSFNRSSLPVPASLTPQKSWEDKGAIRTPEVDLSPSRSSVLFFGTAHPKLAGRGSSRFDSLPNASEREESILSLDEDEVEFIIRDAWMHMMHPVSGLRHGNHRYRLRNYPDTFTAYDIVTWLIGNGYARTSDVAIRVGQALVDTNRLKIVSSLDPLFKNESNLFLELGEAAFITPESRQSSVDSDLPQWFQHLPENVESELEMSISGLSLKDYQASLHYSNPPSEAQEMDRNTVVVSLASLTGEPEATKQPGLQEDTKVPVADDYLVVYNTVDGSDPLAREREAQRQNAIASFSGDGTIVIPVQATLASLSPIASPSHGRSLRSATGGFAVIDNQDVLKAIPVSGLSSAAEAARVIVSGDQTGDISLKSNLEAEAYFEREHDNHFHVVMVQFMQSLGLSLRWISVIKPLILNACKHVHTNIFVEDLMDINEYVKVKKIPVGVPSDSAVVFGVVCSKNITHKKMSHSLSNPTILLLKCAFEFQRKENQLSSFKILEQQEEKYLKNLVARVKTFKPHIILVQKSVSRLALEMLHNLGIVVAVNVKPTVMARVSRSTQGDLLHSLDQLFFDVRLGSCGHFYVKDFTLDSGIKKTLMYFDNCDPKFGCAITLQGGSVRELRKVKRVVRFGLHMVYNANLETAFLVDEFAWPTSPDHQPLPHDEDYLSTCSTPERPLYPSVACPLERSLAEDLAKKLDLLTPEGKRGQTQPAKERECSPVVHFEIGGAKPIEPAPDRLDVNENARGANGEGRMEGTDEESAKSTSTGKATPVDRDTGANGTPAVALDEISPLLSESTDLLSPTDMTYLENLGMREFQFALSNTTFSISPNVYFPTPYLQTVQGRSADTRRYLPKVIYWSHQFKPRSQPPSRERSSDIVTPVLSLEMGLSRQTVEQACGEVSIVGQSKEASPDSAKSLTLRQHTYQSISSHPLTSSLLLLNANTSEMKAALADFRARASNASSPTGFLFPSAREASNFHHHLQDIFNEYRCFEMLVGDSRFDATQRKGEKGKEACSHADGPAETLDGQTNLLVAGKKHKRKRGGRSTAKDRSRESSPVSGGEPAKPAAKGDKQGSTGEPIEHQALKGTLTASSEESKSDAEVSRHFGAWGASARNSLSDHHQPSSSSDQLHSDDTDASQKRSKSPKKRKMGMERFAACENFESLDRGPGAKAVSLAAAGEEGLETGGHELGEEYSYFGMDLGMAAYVQVDCMDPCNHQGLSILFSCTCHDGQKRQLPCVQPVIIQMSYYSRNDLSLGEFLHRYCFRPSYLCQTCAVEMTKHQRHIAHRDTVFHISMQQLDSSIPGTSDGIFTWLACKYCSQCTPYIEMSESSLLYSFAKFLEIKLYCDAYVSRYQAADCDPPCSHSLHSDYVQYFCHKNKIAAFQTAPISILEVLIPPVKLAIATPHAEYLLDYSVELKHVERITEGVFYRIKDRLRLYNVDPISDDLGELIVKCKADRDTFRAKVKWLKDLVVSGGFMPAMESLVALAKKEEDEQLFTLQEGLASLKRQLTDVVECWNNVFEPLDATIRAHRSKRDAAGGTEDKPSSSHGHEPDAPSPSSHSQASRDTPLPSPYGTPPFLTPGSSPDLSLSYHKNASSDSSLAVTSTDQLVAKHHLRNSSDSGLLQLQNSSEISASGDIGLAVGEKELKHRRHASDSTAILKGHAQAEQGIGMGISSANDEAECLSGDASEVEASSSNTDINTAAPSSSPLAVPAPVPSNLSDEVAVRERPEHQRIKSVLGHYSKADGNGRRSPGGGEEHADGTGGLLAKFRGKESDPREDPTKYYLLNPAEMSHSPVVVAQISSHRVQDVHSPRPYHRRPGTIPRRNAPTSAESGSDGISRADRRSVKEKGFLARPFQRLPVPFEPSEHHNTLAALRIPVSIYEKEPTSIIAFALSSTKYTKCLNMLLDGRGEGQGAGHSPELRRRPSIPNLQGRPSMADDKTETPNAAKPSTFVTVVRGIKRISSVLSSSTIFSSDAEATDKSGDTSRRFDYSQSGRGVTGQTSRGAEVGFEVAGEENVGRGWSSSGGDAGGASSGHISLEFTDNSSRFFCKVYFAVEFHKLRAMVFPTGEDRFIHSLCRCVKYDAKGGKSRSAFCKVIDDRFIMKQIKSVEISSFEQFAPHYFTHVTSALEAKRPLILAKILGVYSVGYRNTKTGNSKRLDVLIMENLLYRRQSRKVFDLKGSMRSRYIDPSKDSSSDVLLDENFINYICYTPVYVYPHSKSMIMQGILEDTEFLASNAVMDYSLLTCINESTGELVVGIIDYVRTFTLDKRLEMHLKKAAGRELPTVVYPELYRKRFCDAIERYFTVVPDKWTGLGDIKVTQ